MYDYQVSEEPNLETFTYIKSRSLVETIFFSSYIFIRITRSQEMLLGYKFSYRTKIRNLIIVFGLMLTKINKITLLIYYSSLEWALTIVIYML